MSAAAAAIEPSNRTAIAERTAPPNSVENEQAVLGALLLDPGAFYELPPTLKADDFYRAPHRIIFAAIAALIEAGQPVDVLTVCEKLRGAGQLDLASGAGYVAGLPDLVPSSAHVRFYADAIAETSMRRALIHAHRESIAVASDESRSVADARLECERLLAGVDDRSKPNRTMREAARKAMADLEDRYDGKVAERGITTGLADLDRALFIHDTDFVVVGARPGDGKSILLWQIARHVASAGAPVLFVTLEMNEDELVARAAMDYGSLFVDDVRKPRNDEKAKRLVDAYERIAGLDITLSQETDPTAVLREATRMKRRGGLGLVALDYLQLFDLPKSWGETRDQKIGQLTRMLKRFANEHHVPVIAAAQLKRIEHLQRGRDPRPTLEDLRESGNIEADANAVLLLYRPGVVAGTEEFKKGDRHTADAIVAKQRSGASQMSTPLVAEFEHTRFREPIHPEPDAQQTMGFGR